MTEIFSVFLYPQNILRRFLLETVRGPIPGHTFTCDCPPIKAEARSSGEVAGASCGRLKLEIL